MALVSHRTIGPYGPSGEEQIALHITYHTGQVYGYPVDTLVVCIPVGSPFDPGRVAGPWDMISYMQTALVGMPEKTRRDVDAFHAWMLENRVALQSEEAALSAKEVS